MHSFYGKSNCWRMGVRRDRRRIYIYIYIYMPFRCFSSGVCAGIGAAYIYAKSWCFGARGVRRHRRRIYICDFRTVSPYAMSLHQNVKGHNKKSWPCSILHVLVCSCNVLRGPHFYTGWFQCHRIRCLVCIHICMCTHTYIYVYTRAIHLYVHICIYTYI